MSLTIVFSNVFFFLAPMLKIMDNAKYAENLHPV